MNNLCLPAGDGMVLAVTTPPSKAFGYSIRLNLTQNISWKTTRNSASACGHFFYRTAYAEAPEKTCFVSKESTYEEIYIGGAGALFI